MAAQSLHVLEAHGQCRRRCKVFDASSREYCTVRETRTNTPLQALNLMNDTTYVEAARMMAQRMMNEGGTKPEERLALGLRLAAGRRPDANETQRAAGESADHSSSIFTAIRRRRRGCWPSVKSRVTRS